MTAKQPDGAKRKREHDRRKRAKGFRPVQLWMTENEIAHVKAELERLRSE